MHGYYFNNIMSTDVLITQRATPSAEKVFMMTSSNGNIFRATGHLWGESTGHQ